MNEKTIAAGIVALLGLIQLGLFLALPAFVLAAGVGVSFLRTWAVASVVVWTGSLAARIVRGRK